MFKSAYYSNQTGQSPRNAPYLNGRGRLKNVFQTAFRVSSRYIRRIINMKYAPPSRVAVMPAGTS